MFLKNPPFSSSSSPKGSPTFAGIDFAMETAELLLLPLLATDTGVEAAEAAGRRPWIAAVTCLHAKRQQIGKEKSGQQKWRGAGRDDAPSNVKYVRGRVDEGHDHDA
jgi:hypothetical protein